MNQITCLLDILTFEVIDEVVIILYILFLYLVALEAFAIWNYIDLYVNLIYLSYKEKI